MKCPNCSSTNIGKIGVNQFYCWDCFIELALEDGKLSLNQVEEDGSLTLLDDLFQSSELEAKANGF
ncbi:hypothetical protein [Sporolactobacillus laevolacticus]|uniref:Zn-ribbon containing protein n=1 Tax=Sporolactobacillus laevolacticus DSM 442 TaxID=1395513 RepID=V6J0H9_9BACL|nr:hypothetical protein [Sporolactobacillus laevolacticus]EST13413.1 hypothetical protein P343_01130 [Sporolactobacillus laevolacticus DSM 442]